MAETDAITIEMEPLGGGQQFGPAQPEPQQVSGVTDEQMQLAAQFEQRYGQTPPVKAKQALGLETYDELTPEHRESMRQAVEAGKRAYLEAIRERQPQAIIAVEWSEQRHRDITGALVEATEIQSGRRIEYPGGEPTVNRSWLEREDRLIRESSERAGISPEEIPLAEAYYNGRRDAFNSARENFIEQNPELAHTVPPPIQIQEIRIGQRAIEPETPTLEIAS